MSLHQCFDVLRWNWIEQEHFCLLTGHSQHRPKHTDTETRSLMQTEVQLQVWTNVLQLVYENGIFITRPVSTPD